MMRPDYRAVDHVGAGVALDRLGERLQHGVEHARYDPAPIAPEHAVPLAIFIGQVTPLRARPRHPHHTLEIGAVITGRTATPTALRRKQWADQCPLVIRNPNPLAQCRLQKTALNQLRSRSSTFVHDA